VFLAGCLFFFDVLVRRVQLSLGWVRALAGGARDRLLRRRPEGPEPQYIERLRSRKAQVTDRLEQLRAESRFEPPPEPGGESEFFDQRPPEAAPARPPLPKDVEEQSYTQRLLQAKQKVWQQRNRNERTDT